MTVSIAKLLREELAKGNLLIPPSVDRQAQDSSCLVDAFSLGPSLDKFVLLDQEKRNDERFKKLITAMTSTASKIY